MSSSTINKVKADKYNRRDVEFDEFVLEYTPPSSTKKLEFPFIEYQCKYKGSDVEAAVPVAVLDYRDWHTESQSPDQRDVGMALLQQNYEAQVPVAVVYFNEPSGACKVFAYGDRAEAAFGGVETLHSEKSFEAVLCSLHGKQSKVQLRTSTQFVEPPADRPDLLGVSPMSKNHRNFSNFLAGTDIDLMVADRQGRFVGIFEFKHINSPPRKNGTQVMALCALAQNRVPVYYTTYSLDEFSFTREVMNDRAVNGGVEKVRSYTAREFINGLHDITECLSENLVLTSAQKAWSV